MRVKLVRGFEGIIALAIILSVPPAYAWESDKLMDLNYFYVPRSEMKQEEGEIGLSSAQATGTVPLALEEWLFITLGCDYQGLFVDYRDIPSSEYNGVVYTEDDFPTNLHAIDLILGFNVNWTKKLSTYFEFRPGLHSDLQEVSEDDIYYQGGAMGSYFFSDAFALTLGLYYSDVFGEPELFPLAGVQWQISDDFVLDTLLPDYFVFSYQADDWIRLGLRARLKGHQYRLTEKMPWEKTVIKYNQILAGPFVDLIPARHLVLRLEGGIATMRDFEFRDDDSLEKLYDGDLEDGGYASVSLALQY